MVEAEGALGFLSSFHHCVRCNSRLLSGADLSMRKHETSANWRRTTTYMKSSHFFHPLRGSTILALCWVLFSESIALSAATVVSGNVFGTWTTNDSPFILSANCNVASDQSLTIRPGVEVIIGPNVSLNIEGQLEAIGTPE